MILSKHPMSLYIPIILISIAAVSIAVNFNIQNLITTSNLTTLSSMLKPPYVYVVINVIIIAIAASARFGSHDDQSESSRHARQMISIRKTPEMNLIDVAPAVVYESEMHETEEDILVVKPILIQEDHRVATQVVVEKGSGESETQAWEDEDDLVVSRSVGGGDVTHVSVKFNSAAASSSDLLLPGKPQLLSRRFRHRKPHKSSADGGRALKVARPRREETLEATWKMITEGRHVPLTRHLKKSEPLDNQGRRLSFNKSAMESLPRGTVQKVSESESLTCLNKAGQQMMMAGISGWSPKPMKMKRDPSLSQDELNRRVEAFIKKFNEEMRLQREESLKQYTESMHR